VFGILGTVAVTERLKGVKLWGSPSPEALVKVPTPCLKKWHWCCTIYRR